MHPLNAYDIARQRHAELTAEAHSHRVILRAARASRPAAHPPASSVWPRLRRALRNLMNAIKADEHRETAMAHAAAGVGADGRSATTPLGAPPAPDRRAPNFVTRPVR